MSSPLKILLVEDDVDKARKVVRALLEVDGTSRESVVHVTNSHAAKSNLQQITFDLLILDLMVPTHPDADPSPDEGSRLLLEIRERKTRYRTPGHVIGITQHAELRAPAADVFDGSTVAVLLFSQESDAWQRTLQAAVRHILAAKKTKERPPGGYQTKLAVVCALPMEMDAVRKLPWSWDEHALRFDDDPVAYYRGCFDKGGERQTVVAAVAARMGMPTAAVLTTKMVLRFRPEFVAMTGIAAGVRGSVHLGDVVVADPVWDYGSGKWRQNAGKSEFAIAPHQIGLAPPVRTALTLVAEDFLTLARIREGWSGDPPPHPLRVHVGPMASGASVLADSEMLDRVVEQHRKTLAVEMEAYGVYLAGAEAVEPPPRVIAVKSVVDFAGPEKGDSFQRYGAYTSAAVLQHAMERLL